MLTPTHDWTLVTLSALIAVAASFTALDLAGRVRASEGWPRRAWLATAAGAMGGGIWAMHFVAMLAFSMPGMTVSYDLGLTALSLAVAVVATGIGFFLMSRAGRGWLLGPAGMLMGLGVVAMHYIGMAAMRMPADLSYDRFWVAVSVLIAIGAATAALWLAARGSGSLAERAAAAVTMGAAIAGMHYAGMAAATFTPRGASLAAVASLSRTTLAFDVALATLLILFLALVAAMFDRRFAQMSAREAAALRESEERFRSLYQGTPLPLHSLDAEGRIEQVSDTWCELTGYPRGEVIGRPLVNFLTEASARSAMLVDRERLSSDGFIRDREYRIVTKAGGYRDVLLSARVERSAAGEFLHVLGGLTDVTERRLAEEALRQAQKIEAIGQLTGGVAHDFNNLLAVVVGNLDLLRKRVPEDDPKARRLLESAMEGAQRGAAMTQRLLAFARRQDLRPEAVDVPNLVRGMADLLQRSLGPMVKVETKFPLSLPPARVDAHQLEMALLNLAVNARDAMPEGGTLEIAAAGELVPEGLGVPPGPYLKLSLADTGEGMDEATLARAAEPFFTTKGVGKGTGLGLSMVQGLAAQSGGRLAIRSVLGRGTAVELLLPVAEPQAAPAPVAVALPARLPSRRILAVDDDRLVLANTVAMLDDLGHEVHPAVSGQDALDQLADGLQVDIVVTDQLMPGMTGTQLAARLRRDHPGLPVLLVSGFAELAPGTGGELAMLRKPFQQAALAAALAGLGGDVVPLRRAG